MQLAKDEQGTKVLTRTRHDLYGQLINKITKNNNLIKTFVLRKGEICMVKPTESHPKQISSRV